MRDNALRSGERQVAPDIAGIEPTHLGRYDDAVRYIMPGDTVLDLCCGCGYGSYMISHTAKQVIGVDISFEAIEYAKVHWSRDNTTFRCMDISREEVSYAKEHYCQEYSKPSTHANFDVVICYEGIEHIENTYRLFLYFKHLNPRIIIVSAPHLLCPAGANKFHFRHYGMDELLERFWDIGYKPVKAELTWYKNGLNNLYIGEKR